MTPKGQAQKRTRLSLISENVFDQLVRSKSRQRPYGWYDPWGVVDRLFSGCHQCSILIERNVNTRKHHDI